MRLSVHTSDRTSFKRCRQKWDFSSNLRMNLESKSPITPLFFGTNVHAALAYYYDPDTPRDAVKATAVFVAKTYQYLDQFENPDVEKQQWVADQIVLGGGMLKHYFLNYAPRHDDFQVVYVEQQMEVPIPGLPGVSYTFTLDGLVIDKYGRYWILEHKTAAQLFEDQEWLVNDDQCGSYLWALTQLSEPIYAEGVIYNSLRKKVPQGLKRLVNGGFSINKSQDTTFDIAIATLREEYGKIPRKYWDFLDFLKEKPENFVQRVHVRRNKKEIQILGESLRHEVLDMINNPTIYRSPSRINCSGCQFLVPCIMKWEGSDYEYYLESQYKGREKQWV